MAWRMEWVNWIQGSAERSLYTFLIYVFGNGCLVSFPASYPLQHPIPFNQLIGLVGRVFANGPLDLGSITGCVIPKTLKMVLDISLVNTQQYKVRIKGKVEQSRERNSALPWCNSYWKGSFLVALDYGRQLYFTDLGLSHFMPNSV